MLCDERILDQREIKESMIIIYSGTLAVTIAIENGQDYVIDYIQKGSILNAHNFLAGRQPNSSIKCLTAVTYYYLPLGKLEDISVNYPVLRSTLSKAQQLSKYNMMLDLNPLDYKEVNFKFEEKYTMREGEKPLT